MKVILLEDVNKVGKKGDIVELKDGYARNCIINKKLGVEYDQKSLNDLKLKKAHEEKVEKEKYETALKMKEILENGEVNILIKAGKNGKLFGSISSKEIAELAKEQLGVEIDKKKIVIGNTIKELGITFVSVKLHTKVIANLKVVVNERD